MLGIFSSVIEFVMLHIIILYYIILCYVMLCYVMLYYIILYYIILYYIILYYIILTGQLGWKILFRKLQKYVCYLLNAGRVVWCPVGKSRAVGLNM
jgi:hypothetical protein